MRSLRALACAVAWSASGCTPSASQDAPTKQLADAREPVRPEPTVSESEPLPRVLPPEPAPPEPALPSFDPITATGAKVRIVVLHDQKWWSLCGILHSVGAIEVEVLEVGEPPPRMALYVSCPADLGRELLRVGNVVEVTFHRRKQSWPKPPVELPAELPLRYMASIRLAPMAELDGPTP